MRPSRISRDTARALPSLSRRTAVRRSLPIRPSSSPLDDGPAETAAAATRQRSAGSNVAIDSGSELSTPPPPDDSSDEYDGRQLVASTSSRKRKRGIQSAIPAKSSLSSRTRTNAAATKKKKKETSRTEVKVETSLAAVTNSRPKKARRTPAKKVVASNGTVKIEAPANWEEMYAVTREMRKTLVAPVDTMGCERLADTTRSPRDQRFQTLVALMLSSQTKDTVTAVAMKNMQENMPGGFCLESVLSIEPADLNKMIEKVGFHNNKTKYIKQAAQLLKDSFNSDIPDTVEGLVSLPGVGPKMAYLTMSAAWGRDEGIGVDVHVHRITNLWGWHKTKNPEETRALLEAWLPREKWHDINTLLVGFGQMLCLPVGRKCGECKLAERGLCPSAVVGKKFIVKKEEALTDGVADGVRVKLEEDAEQIQAVDIKAEDVATGLVDIEDLGGGGGTSPPARRSRRTK